MEKPTEVQIGPYLWQICYDAEELRHLYRTGADDMFGATFEDQQRIVVDDERPLQSIKDTVLHEIIHAIFDTYGMRMPNDPDIDEQEERLVVALSPMLLDVMQKNADLVRWLSFRE